MISRLRTQAKAKAWTDITENLFRVIIRQSRVKQTFTMQYKGSGPVRRAHRRRCRTDGSHVCRFV